MKWRPIRYEQRIIACALAALVPMLVAALVLAFAASVSPLLKWTLLFLAAGSLFVATWVIHEQVVYPLRTLANLVSALREEDYSLRGRNPGRNDVFSEVLLEINSLASTMESRKRETAEAAALLRTVLGEIDAAIFAFDTDLRIRLVNRAGERLLRHPSEWLTGKSARELGIDDLLADDGPEMIDRTFDGSAGRWSVRRSTFRDKGVANRLLVIADISRPLREEEALAWQRIVRVLSHELNNSLAPIRSIAASTESMIAREILPDDWRVDVTSGMRVISSRADSLARFTRAYSELARLPRPRKAALDLEAIVRRVVALEHRMAIDIIGGPSLVIDADSDQIEQALINLVKNGADAALENGGAVSVAWTHERQMAEVLILDEGAGLAGSANLFVPFFTTKANGSGIGLVLSRQIAEAHGGTVTLENRKDGQGCVASLRIPLV